MRSFTIAVLVAATVAGASAIAPVVDGSLTIEQEFDYWAQTYGKAYENDAVKAERRAIFQSHRQLVINHNAAYARGEESFTLELNHLADLTNAEYREQYLGLKGGNPASLAFGTHKPKTDDIPDAWDWRDTPNVVGPVKNQGQCGSCWAFSAVATMEGVLNNATGKVNSLSEQELVDCVNGGADTCALGGEMYQGVEYGISKGMMSESDYSYTGSSGSGCKFDKSKVVHKYSGYINVTSGDENALKSAAYERPIVSVGIDASSIWFQLYSGGVYDVKSCKNDEPDLDHGVAVVGYGTSKGKDYWWVRNSWGSFWGLKGYIMMSRNADNQCGIATQACYAGL